MCPNLPKPLLLTDSIFIFLLLAPPNTPAATLDIPATYPTITDAVTATSPVNTPMLDLSCPVSSPPHCIETKQQPPLPHILHPSFFVKTKPRPMTPRK